MNAPIKVAKIIEHAINDADAAAPQGSEESFSLKDVPGGDDPEAKKSKERTLQLGVEGTVEAQP